MVSFGIRNECPAQRDLKPKVTAKGLMFVRSRRMVLSASDEFIVPLPLTCYKMVPCLRDKGIEACRRDTRDLPKVTQ